MTTSERKLFVKHTYNQVFHLAFPEIACERTRKWAMANPEKKKASDIAWQRANPEKCSVRNRRWVKRNPEKVNAKAARYYKRHPEKCRARRLKNQYNLTPEEWQKILDFQKGLCAICGRPASDFKRSLHVDHDHSTKLVRGLLCWQCNSLLPNRRDLTLLLGAAVDYLNSPPASRALGEDRRTGKPTKRD